MWLFVVAIISVPAGMWAVVKWHQQNHEPLPVLGQPSHRVGAFSVIDQNGNHFNERSLNDKVVVANFFFTHCPVVCPKMIRQLKRVQSYSDPNILIASFSVDPERDSVALLKKYAEKHELRQNWLLLTGNKREIYRLARKDFLLLATDGDGGPDDYIHSDNLVLIDAQKRIRGFYKGTDEREVNQLIRDIQKLHQEQQ
jgi:protein SCO1/2